MKIYLTTYGNHLWYQAGHWTNDPDCTKNHSSAAYYKTIRKARRVAVGILNRWPNTMVEITRNYKHFEIWEN